MNSKTILVVDDDVEMAMIIKESLEQQGFGVLMAHDGLQAVEKTKRNKIDLILLDVRMPFFSGFWFCDAFKQREQTKNIPIVMISGVMDDDSIQKARDLGAAACLRKPFKPSELVEVVEKNLAAA
jgi:CheY-like chemotaxis protein